MQLDDFGFLQPQQWVDGRMDGQTDAWMAGWPDGRIE